MLINSLFKSYRSKVLFQIALVFISIATLIIIVSSIIMYNALIKSSEEKIEYNLKCAAEKISLSNIEADAISKTMALSQNDVLFGKRESSVELVGNVLEATEMITGASIGYEPNADGKDDLYKNSSSKVSPAIDETGRFIPYWFRPINNPNNLSLEKLVDMNTSMYYQGVKERFYSKEPQKSLITEPYIYEGKMMVEHCSPIVRNKRFYGVSCVDRALFDIDKFLNNLKPYKTVDFDLVSRLGKVISSTYNQDSKTKSIKDLTSYNIFNNLFDSKNDKIQEHVFNQKEYYYSAAVIKPGDWVLIMRVAKSEILAPIYNTLLLSILIALMCVIISVFVINKITFLLENPINDINSYAKQIGDGVLSERKVHASGAESNELLEKINQLRKKTIRLINNIDENSKFAYSAAGQINNTAKSQKKIIENLSVNSGKIKNSFYNIVLQNTTATENMESLFSAVKATSERTKNSISVLDNMNINISKLNEATSRIGRKFEILIEKTSNVSTVLQTINRIADRTNLLSLNAAIEAEKAGEQGKSFAVIASEITELAERTIDSTYEIEKQINDLQNNVSNESLAINKFNKKVDEIVIAVNQVNISLKESILGFTETLPSYSLIKDSLEEKTSVTKMMLESVNTLNNNSNENEIYLQRFSLAADGLILAIDNLLTEIKYFNNYEN